MGRCHIEEVAGPPTLAPMNCGDHYCDTTNGFTYISTGTSSVDDWILLNKVAVQVNLSNFTNYSSSGFSSAIPMNTTIFETVPTMHDPTVSDSGTATGTQSVTTLQDTSKAWTINEFTDFYVRTTGGTGLDRFRKIISNTADTLTISSGSTDWVVTPVTASTTYEITELSTRLVAPVKGIYTATFTAAFEKPTTNSLYGVRFDLNGSFNAVKYNHMSGTTEHEWLITKSFSLDAGDYLEASVYQGNGAEKKFYGSSRMYFELIKQ